MPDAAHPRTATRHDRAARRSRRLPRQMSAADPRPARELQELLKLAPRHLTATEQGPGRPPIARRWAAQARQRLRGNYVQLLSGTIVGQAAMLLGTPLISRLYAPREVGAFMVLMACATVGAHAVTWRLELALVAERHEPSARSLLALCLAVVAPTSASACSGAAVWVRRACRRASRRSRTH